MAASTLGTFLRSFTFGHVRQLDRVLAETLRRAWTAGAGPGDARLVIDLDSFIGGAICQRPQRGIEVRIADAWFRIDRDKCPTYAIDKQILVPSRCSARSAASGATSRDS
jgi:hypothetical protein